MIKNSWKNKSGSNRKNNINLIVHDFQIFLLLDNSYTASEKHDIPFNTNIAAGI
jgi:hypothetical protein